jgi:molybdopterin converting factor subunit 1
MKSITVRLFASLREAAGQSVVHLELENEARVADVWGALCDISVELEQYRGRALVALNRRYVSTDVLLSDGDDLALFPPVSGG